jgi:hypothetical protein
LPSKDSQRRGDKGYFESRAHLQFARAWAANAEPSSSVSRDVTD